MDSIEKGLKISEYFREGFCLGSYIVIVTVEGLAFVLSLTFIVRAILILTFYFNSNFKE